MLLAFRSGNPTERQRKKKTIVWHGVDHEIMLQACKTNGSGYSGFSKGTPICHDVLTENWGKGLEVAEFHLTPDLRDAQGHDVTFHLVQAEPSGGWKTLFPPAMAIHFPKVFWQLYS